MGHFKFRVFFLALLFVICSSKKGFSQANLEVEKFSAIDGFSGQIKDVKEDSGGNLWILTTLQVHKYNPAGTETYSKFSGLPSDVGTLNSIFIDRDDQVWITADGGLLKFDPGKKEFTRLSTNGVQVRQITGGKTEALWIATNEGIWISDGKDLSFVAGFPGEHLVHDLLRVGDQLLIGTSRGFFSLTTNGTLRIIPLPGYEKAGIRKILFDGSSYFLGTERDGLLRMSADFKGLQKIYSLPSSSNQVPVTGLVSNNTGEIYISTLGDGLVVLDRDLRLVNHLRKEEDKTPFLDNKLTQIFLDRFDRLWVATESAGLLSINLKQHVFELLQNDPRKYSSLSNNFTTAIEKDSKGNLWFGTKEGLSVWNRKTDTWQHLKNLSFTRRFSNPDVIKDLQADDEHMWVATFNDGVYKININTLLRAHYSVDARNRIDLQKASALQRDNKNNIWIAGEDGGLIQIRRSGEIKQFSLDGISSMTKSASGELIAGGKKGVFRIFPENGDIEQITSLMPNERDLPYLNINGIRESVTGELVFATEGAGVVVYDPLEDSFQIVSKESGLPSNSIKSIEIFGRNDVWVGTTTGLSNFRISQIPEIRTFGESEGLSSLNFTGSSVVFDNRLAFGTNQGVQIFNPSEIKKLKVNMPLLAVNEVKVRNKENKFRKISLDQPVELAENENSLSFSFAGSQPGSDTPLLYSWRLTGFDDNWSEPEAQNKISFASLSPGNYVFEVKGVSANGSWSEVRGVPFSIRAPWWTSSRAFLGFGSAVFLLGLLIIGTFRIFRRRKDKEAKSALLADLNQELGAPLDVLLTTLDNIAEDEDGRHKTRLKTATSRLREIIEPIHNLQEAGKPKPLQISEVAVEEYFNDLLWEINPLLKEKNLEIILNNQFSGGSFYYDELYLNKIFVNLFTGSFRYSALNGKIIINLIATNKGDLKTQITDNGPGIPEKEKKVLKEYFQNPKTISAKETKLISNLIAVKDLLQRSGGSIAFESSKNEGTTFTLILFNHRKSSAVPAEKPAEKASEKTSEKITAVEEEPEIISTADLLHPSEAPLQETISEEAEDHGVIHILVVQEDGELKAEMEALKQLGEVHEVQNVIEAYQLAVKLAPNCIITSAGRPGIDGLVLWKALRNNPDLSEIPVYLIYTEAEYLETAGITKQVTLIPVKKANNPENFLQLIADKQDIPLKASFSNPNLAERNSKLLKKEVEEDFLEKLQKLIIENADESSFSVEELSNAMGVRRKALETVIEDCKGIALEEFIVETKLDYARSLILKGDSDLSEVARKTGFRNKDIFFFLYKKHFGFMPGRIIEKD